MDDEDLQIIADGGDRNGKLEISGSKDNGIYDGFAGNHEEAE